ncbi:monocarboxylate transporter 12-B-like [Dermacentor variabilis]|uniref:monocarboxylate transporter 12-B-like n=1 Tax=Dermacentor variabilis TaxID=34621 RepID=UPI003F5B3432
MCDRSRSPSAAPRVAQPHLLDSLWSVPLITAAAAFLSTVGVSNHGFFYVLYMGHYGATRQEASWPASIHSIACHVIGLVLAALQRTVSVHNLTLIGGLFSWMGFVLSAFAPNIQAISVTMGVIYAMGSGTMVIMLSVYNITYFMKYRGVATGFKFVGWSLSGLVFPPILTILFNTYGFQGGMLLLGGIVMNVMVFIMLLSNPRAIRCCTTARRKISRQLLLTVAKNVCDAETVFQLPVEIEVKASGQSQGEPSENQSLCAESLCAAFAPLKAPIFYAFLPSFVLCDYGDMLLSTTIVDYAIDKGLTVAQAKHMIICISLAGLLGRLLLPLAADRGYLSRSALVALCYVFITLACMALPHVHSVAGVWMVCFVAAAQFGCLLTMKGVLVADYLGIEHIAAAIGVTGLAMLPLLLGNPAIIGYFRDTRGSYDNLFRSFAALAFLVAMMLLGLVCHERTTNKFLRRDNRSGHVNYGATI